MFCQSGRGSVANSFTTGCKTRTRGLFHRDGDASLNDVSKVSKPDP